MNKLVRMGLILLVVCGTAALLDSPEFAGGAAVTFAIVSLNMTYEDWVAARRVERWRNKRQRKKAA